MVTVSYNGHTIEIRKWTDKIYYDGRLVSSKNFKIGGKTNHIFSVKENGKTIEYEVEITAGLLRTFCVVRREGKAIFAER